MKGRKLKRFIVIILILIIAGVSTEFMLSEAGTKDKITYTVVMAKHTSDKASNVLDGVRDYALENDMILDVYYEENMTTEEYKKLISEETSNGSRGFLLIYPEEYLEWKANDGDSSDDILAVTDAMKKAFTYSATFQEQFPDAYDLPVDSKLIQKLQEDEASYIYVNNTYKLGYLSLKMLGENGGTLKNVTVESTRIDGKMLKNGEVDELFVE